jgi:cation transport ATPase
VVADTVTQTFTVLTLPDTSVYFEKLYSVNRKKKTMEWYIPLTILPAIGMIILSTTNFIISLNTEISNLELEEQLNTHIIVQKVDQLKRLGIANAFLYSSGLLFMFSSLSKAFFQKELIYELLMVLAAIMATFALVYLFIHSIKSIQIRQEHLKL